MKGMTFFVQVVQHNVDPSGVGGVMCDPWNELIFGIPLTAIDLVERNRRRSPCTVVQETSRFVLQPCEFLCDCVKHNHIIGLRRENVSLRMSRGHCLNVEMLADRLRCSSGQSSMKPGNAELVERSQRWVVVFECSGIQRYFQTGIILSCARNLVQKEVDALPRMYETDRFRWRSYDSMTAVHGDRN